LGLLLAILLLIRGFREERLSDKLLAAVLFLLAMEIQDYTFVRVSICVQHDGMICYTVEYFHACIFSSGRIYYLTEWVGQA
jgi:hypothetical protein